MSESEIWGLGQKIELLIKTRCLGVESHFSVQNRETHFEDFVLGPHFAKGPRVYRTKQTFVLAMLG